MTSSVSENPVVEVEVTESIVPDSIDIERTEQKSETDNVEQLSETTVQYSRDPLESVQNGTNTLYVLPLLIT